MPYSAYVFDFDFTLADATPGIVASVNYALGELGYPAAGVEPIRRTVGMTLRDTFTTLTGCDDEDTAVRFTAFFRARADEVMTDNTTLLPGVAVALAGLKADGAKTAIVTSKFHYRIDQALARHGCSHLVDFIVGLEDVAEAKPSPEGLLRAMDALGVGRGDTLYVGDSLIDARTAQNAGVDFAAVTTGTTGAEEFAGLPHVAVAGSMAALFAGLEFPG